MRRLTRWQVWLPWTLLVGVLLLATQYTAGRLVRSSIVRTGEAVVGERVELGGARVSLARGDVTLHELRIAEAQSPTLSLLKAGICQLDLSPGALFARHKVAERGEVVGLEIGTPVAADGVPSAVAAGFDRRPVELTDQWLAHVESQFDRDLAGQFESVRLADELLARWPQRSAALRKRLRKLQQRAAELAAGVDNAQVNPLRHDEFLDTLPEQVAVLRGEFEQLAAEINKLPDAVETERRAIIAARRNDAELLHDALRVEAIEPNALAAYLLAGEVAGPAENLVGWLRWVRQVMPVEAAERGGRQGRVPDWRVRMLAVQGTAWVGSLTLPLAGTIANLASDPVLAGRPIEVRLRTAGKLPLELAATIDRTRPLARDELVAEGQSIFLPMLRLGGADRLRLAVRPSVASLKVHVRVEGVKLLGDAQVVLTQPHITPEASGKLTRLQVTDALAQELRGVTSVTVRLSLSGTLDQPRWRLESDLGPVVSQTMTGALARAAERHSDELLVRSQRHVDEQLARLDRQMADLQAALLPQLAGRVRVLEQLAQRQQPPPRITPNRVGRRLPAGSLFR